MELLGRKLGMTQIFTEAGDRIPVTVVETGPCTVVQLKSEQTDGYTAVQLGFLERKADRTPKPLKGHFDKAKVTPRRHLFEVRVSAAEAESLEVGKDVTCESLEPGQRVDVTGTSKGRGFTGVIKRWGFATHSSTHGTHEFFRHGGAISAGTYPGRVFKGKKMAGHMGNKRVTTRGLEVARVDADKNLVFLRGAVPGHANSIVRLRPSARPSASV